MVMVVRAIVIAAVATLVACGTDDATIADAAGVTDDAFKKSGPCWSDQERVPTASAILGTGRSGFVAMPEMLPIEYGSQDGYNLVANVRMSGLEPGNPKNLLDPTNPRTRIRAFFADDNLALNSFSRCPFRNAYVPAAGGGYELAEGIPVIFETCWRDKHLIGRRVRIELDLIDVNGGYAKTVTTVTLVAPIASYPADDPAAMGCRSPLVNGLRSTRFE